MTAKFKTIWDDYGPFDVNGADDPFAKPRCLYCRRPGGALVGWRQFMVHVECRLKAVAEPPAAPPDITGHEVRFSPYDGCGSSKATLVPHDGTFHLKCIRCSVL